MAEEVGVDAAQVKPFMDRVKTLSKEFQSKYPNPYFNENDIGGSFGGPIPHLKKTWFFTSYERDYFVNTVKFQSSTAAHPDMYTGNFSQIDPDERPAVPDSILAEMTPQEITDNTDASTGTVATLPAKARYDAGTPNAPSPTSGSPAMPANVRVTP
jgi:hypothetical protein